MKSNWPTKKLGETDLRVLTLAKAMYLRGCSFGQNNDEVSRMLAIHTCDNAIEIVLKLIVKQNSKTPKDREWKFYDLVKEVYGDGAFKIQITDLHEQRNQAQHAADIPSQETIGKYLTRTEDFLKDVCKKKFDISYEEVSLALLIADAELRSLFKEAEDNFENKKYKETIEQCDEALIKAVFDAGDIFSKAGNLTGYFKGGDELGEIIKDTYAEKYKNSDHYEFVKEVSKAFLQLGMSTTAMQFFDEYRIDFLQHRKRVEGLNQIPEEQLKSEAQESLNFMLNIILKWQKEKLL